MKYLPLLVLIGNHAFSQKRIDTTEVITIGGIKQCMLVKGKDISKPLLLFLHGGPGASLIGKADKITGNLQEQFVVVHWDQRETGKTQQLNKTTQPLTLQLFYNDTHDLIDSLLRRFQKPKLYLVGYSWGSVPGFYIADKYPELLYAYIAVSPVINQMECDRISLAILKREMGKKARQELSPVKVPFENWEQLYYHRKWLYKHEGQNFVSLALRKSFVQSWAATWFDVWTEATSLNLFETMPAIKCPVYFFAGENDYHTNSSVTKEYYQKLSASKKDLFLFANTGHGLPETNSGQFQYLLITKILAQTLNE